MAETIKFGPQWIRMLSDGGTSGSNGAGENTANGERNPNDEDNNSNNSSNVIPQTPKTYSQPQYQYSREDVLALYPPSSEMPVDIDPELEYICIEKTLHPVSFGGMSEEEMRLMNQTVNSNAILRKQTPNPPVVRSPSERGSGRGRGRGDASGFYREEDPGYSRPRHVQRNDSWYEDSNSNRGYNSRGNYNNRQFESHDSEISGERSSYLRSGSNNDNWRSHCEEDQGGNNDGWKRMASKNDANGRWRGSPQSNSWRDNGSTYRQNSYNYHGTQGGGGGYNSSGYQHNRGKSSECLPEWSLSEPQDSNSPSSSGQGELLSTGSFDSSGAFVKKRSENMRTPRKLSLKLITDADGEHRISDITDEMEEMQMNSCSSRRGASKHDAMPKGRLNKPPELIKQDAQRVESKPDNVKAILTSNDCASIDKIVKKDGVTGSFKEVVFDDSKRSMNSGDSMETTNPPFTGGAKKVENAWIQKSEMALQKNLATDGDPISVLLDANSTSSQFHFGSAVPPPTKTCENMQSQLNEMISQDKIRDAKEKQDKELANQAIHERLEQMKSHEDEIAKDKEALDNMEKTTKNIMQWFEPTFKNDPEDFKPPVKFPNMNLPGYSATDMRTHEPKLSQFNTTPISKKDRWTYIDPNDQIQGPFSNLEMEDWFNAGYFKHNLNVKRTFDLNFNELGMIVKKLGHLPFDAKHMYTAAHNPDANDGLLQHLLPNQIPSGHHALHQQQQQQQQQHIHHSQHLAQPINQHVGNSNEINHQLTGQPPVNHLNQGAPMNHMNHGAQINHLVQGAPMGHPSQSSSMNQQFLNRDQVAMMQQQNKMYEMNHLLLRRAPEQRFQANSGTGVIDTASNHLTQNNDHLYKPTDKHRKLEHDPLTSPSDPLSVGNVGDHEDESIWDISPPMPPQPPVKNCWNVPMKHVQPTIPQQQQQQQRIEPDYTSDNLRCEQDRLVAEQVEEEEERLRVKARREQHRLEAEIAQQEVERQLEHEKLKAEQQRAEGERIRLARLAKQVEKERKEREKKIALEEARIQEELLKEKELLRKKVLDEKRKKIEIQLEIARLSDIAREQSIREQEALRLEVEREAERKKQESLKKQQKLDDLKLPTSAGWGNKQVSAKFQVGESLSTIQQIQIDKQAKLQKAELENQKRAKEALVKEQKMNLAKSWSSRVQPVNMKTSSSSLLDIQNEQERQLPPSSKNASKAVPVVKVTPKTPVKMPVVQKSWNNNSQPKPVVRPLMDEAIWESVQKEKPFIMQKTKKSRLKIKKLNAEIEFFTAKQQPQPSSVSKPVNSNRQQKKELEKMKLGEASKSKAEFMAWCEKALRGIAGNVDVPTFAGFIVDIESPYEVRDYVKGYIGDNPTAARFAEEFISNRSAYRNKINGSPSTSANTQATDNDQNAFVYVSGKGGKKNKKKMQKLDNSILGFTVHAAPDRLNAGEIDYN